MRRPLVICGLLAVCLVTNIAFGVGYLTLKGVFHFQAVSPNVQFYRWSDGTRTNEIELDMSMTPDEWTIIDNATYGLINKKSGPQDCAFYVDSISITENRPANLTVQIINATDLKATWTTTTWDNLGVLHAVPFTMSGNEKATIKLMVLACEEPVDCDVTFKLEVPSEGT